jgi:hypothetical protein
VVAEEVLRRRRGPPVDVGRVGIPDREAAETADSPSVGHADAVMGYLRMILNLKETKIKNVEKSTLNVDDRYGKTKMWEASDKN